jgi:hypothetical protein
VVRAAEQAPGEQRERGKDADELHRQQPDRQSHPAVGEQADPDEALKRRDRDDARLPRDEPEGQQVDRGDRQTLGGADMREVLQNAEAQEHRADRKAQRRDAVAHECPVQRVLEVDEPAPEKSHAGFAVAKLRRFIDVERGRSDCPA